MRELTPDKDKVARAMPVTAAFEGGRLLLPRSASWLRDLEQEVLSFPLGQHDDQVDCLGYAVAAGKLHRGPSLALAGANGDSDDDRYRGTPWEDTLNPVPLGRDAYKRPILGDSTMARWQRGEWPW